MKTAIVSGFVTKVETVETKNGSWIFSFGLCDRTDSIIIKKFFDKKDKKSIPEIKRGQWLKVSGRLKIDEYNRGELTLFFNNICPVQPQHRMDNSPVKRVELHAHTKFSAMDATINTSEIVATAAEFGHSALAITDHGVVQAFPDLYKAAKKHNIKPLFGMEGYLVEATGENPEKNPSFHILILAKDYKGLKNLYSLVSSSHLDYFHGRPRITRDKLLEFREGLILGTACEAGELFQALLGEADDEKLAEIAHFYDFIEIQPISNNRFLIETKKYSFINNDKDLQALNQRLYNLGQRINKPVVATGDAHFLEPEDSIFRAILMAGQGYNDPDNQASLYFKTTDEMLEEFAYLGQEEAQKVVVENPRKIADSIQEMRPIPQGFYPPEIPGDAETLRRLTIEKALELYGDPLPEGVKNRMERELSAICDNGFAVLYYIARELVNHSLENGFVVGSRGSVGSSFVANLFGITEVNPLPPHYCCPKCRYYEENTQFGSGVDMPSKNCPHCGQLARRGGFNIPFETFMGFKGDKVPDIDLNFSGDIQGRIHKFVEDFFGRDQAYRAGTISTLQEQSIQGFVKGYFQERNRSCKRAEFERLTEACSGIKKTTGQHPGGIILVPHGMDIHQFTPVQRPANDKNSDTITTHFDYHVMDEQLVKLDILGHDDPTILKMLSDLSGIDPLTVPLDDELTMQLFSQVKTLGIPEFTTPFTREMTATARPTCFADLVRISGLSHGTQVWLGNAEELIKNGVPLSQVISIRDDILIFLMDKGLDSAAAFKIMEQVRKGKSITQDQEKLMRDNNVPDWYIQSCKKIQYMFPKAHAVAYVTSAYRIAWFKAHHPIYFYATYFSVRCPDKIDCAKISQGMDHLRWVIQDLKDRMEKEKVSRGDPTVEKVSKTERDTLTHLEVALEAMGGGINFLPVDIYLSQPQKYGVEGENLRCPFSSIPGIGVNAAEKLSLARQAGFTSVQKLKAATGLSQTAIETLRAIGALNGIPEEDQLSLF